MKICLGIGAGVGYRGGGGLYAGEILFDHREASVFAATEAGIGKDDVKEYAEIGECSE